MGERVTYVSPEGHRHCGKVRPWAELDYSIVSDGEGGLLWVWACPECGETIASQSFAFPADYP